MHVKPCVKTGHQNLQSIKFPMVYQGRPQDLGGGGQEFFFSDLGIRHAAHGEAMRIARGVRGHAPRENFLKQCNLVRFRVYFDQILSLFFSKKCHFLYKK